MDNRTADHVAAPGIGGVPATPAPDLPQVAPPIDAPSSNLLSRLRRNRFLKAAIALLVLIVGAWMLARQLYGWHHFDAGKRELARDHCRPALEHFQAALVIWPDDATTQFLAARASRRLGDYEAADSYLTRCQLSPAIREQAELERVLLRACRGEVEAVGGYCQTLLRQHHPDTPLILEALAQGELSLLRFAAAAHYLERWLEMAPDHPQAIYRKGQLQLEAGNLQEALALLRRAAELDPDREDVRLLLAGLYLDLGQAQEGVPHLEFVCGRQPKNHLAKARLAQGLVLLGREEEAIRLLDEVLLARPEHAPALLERGKLAFRHGDLDKAQHLLQEACKRDPGNRAAHYQLLQCLKQQGNDKEVRIVQTRLDQIHLDEARLREITTALLPQRRNDPDLYAELGELYLRMGAMKDGLHWLNRAVEIAPRHPAAHRELAKHHQSLGQHGQAQYHRELGGVTVPAPEPPKE